MGFMETIIEYLEREQRTFGELAFSPVDSLVLSSLVYFNFDAAGVVERQSATPVRLHDVVALTPPSMTSSPQVGSPILPTPPLSFARSWRLGVTATSRSFSSPTIS